MLEATKKEAREKDRKLRQKEKEDKELNGQRNGDVSPKKVWNEYAKVIHVIVNIYSK